MTLRCPFLVRARRSTPGSRRSARRTRPMIEFAIVGLGSWGLCVLERTVVRARQIERADPGARGRAGSAGRRRLRRRASPTTWSSTTPAGSCPSTPPPTATSTLPTPWASTSGPSAGLPLGGLRVPDRHRGRAHPAHRLPAPPADGRVPGLVLRHPAGRRPAEPRDRPPLRRRRRHLAGDRWPRGGAARQRRDPQRRPRRADLGPHLERRARRRRSAACATCAPIRSSTSTSRCPPGAPVAIAGMGLVGFDVLTALTVGRGGTFEDVGRRASATCRAVASRTSTSTPARASPTAPSRPTASIPTVSTSRWCARPRRSPS